MHQHIEWLGALAADPKISNATIRLAVAIAVTAGDRGRYRGRSLPLAVAAQQSSRHQKDTLESLERAGYLRIHLYRGGRMDVEILTPPDADAPISTKPFHQAAGSIVAAIEPPVPHGRSKIMNLYVETDTAMTKLTIPRADAEKIAETVMPRSS